MLEVHPYAVVQPCATGTDAADPYSVALPLHLNVNSLVSQKSALTDVHVFY